MKAQKFAGLGILLAVALIIAGIRFNGNGGGDNPPGRDSDITVSGIIGTGKAAFFNDPDVKRILKDEYGLTVVIDKEIGSNGQVKECVEHHAELDFCWGSSEIAGEQIKQGIVPTAAKSAIIFNSPIVMYTWGPIADALVAQGIAEKT